MSAIAEAPSVVFALNTLFALWVVFRKGAEWLAKELARDVRFRNMSR